MCSWRWRAGARCVGTLDRPVPDVAVRSDPRGWAGCRKFAQPPAVAVCRRRGSRCARAACRGGLCARQRARRGVGRGDRGAGRRTVAFDAGRAAQKDDAGGVERGVGSCPNGMPDPRRVGRVLGLEEGERPVIVLTFGYPARARDPQRRSPEGWVAGADRSRWRRWYGACRRVGSGDRRLRAAGCAAARRRGAVGGAGRRAAVDRGRPKLPPMCCRCACPAGRARVRFRAWALWRRLHAGGRTGGRWGRRLESRWRRRRCAAPARRRLGVLASEPLPGRARACRRRARGGRAGRGRDGAGPVWAAGARGARTRGSLTRRLDRGELLFPRWAGADRRRWG